MQRPETLTPVRVGRLDRLARAGDGLLRRLGDVRVGIGLLLVAGAVNALAAAMPSGAWLLRTPPYLALLGAVLVTGIAAVAVRTPPAWREWRRPVPLVASRDALRAEIPLAAEQHGAAEVMPLVAQALRRAGYRVVVDGADDRAVVAGVRRGWAHFAGLLAHLAVVAVVVGAGIGLAFGHEETFSLLPGQQALLDAGRPGFSDAVRLERFDAAFGADGRPSRLDTQVTFLRDGRPVQSATLQVNSPGSFDGYLVHGWTYGPAVQLRAVTLAGRPLLDSALPLDALIGGVPGAFSELPTLGVTLGISLVDATANRLRVTAADSSGLLDSATLQPGTTQRIGPVEVTIEELSTYVTFLSRRDPGMGILFGGVACLVAGLAVALWLPRRRVTVRASPSSLIVTLRGGRLEDAAPELRRVEAAIRAVAARSA